MSIEGVGESSISIKRKRLTSLAWTYFNIVEKENRRAGSCKICAQVIFGDLAAGTTNLKRHLSGKHGINVEDESEFSGCPFTQDSYREKVAFSIVKHGYPFSMVEHEGTRDLHSYLNHSVKFICRNTAKSDVLKLYQRGVQNLRNELDCVPGRICLTSDMWHSTTSDGYMSLTAHYIDSEWKLQSRLLAFHHVPPPHNGPVLAERLYDLLKEWKVERKVLTLTLDNARYNDSAVNSLKAYFDIDGTSIQGNEFLHVRCGAHVLNLIVKSGLSVIENAIHNIRESVKYVKGSEIRMKKFATYTKQLSIVSKKKLQQDVSTRWNSTYNMLERALIFKDAFKQLDVFDSDYKFCPTWDEWSKVEKMAKFLQPFNEMTILFSGRTYPTANLYFENVWKIQMRLQQSKYSPDDLIREMAVSMEPMFLKYWECYSMILSFAVVLDPRYKFILVEFAFQKLNPHTKDENVSRVRQKLFALYEEYSKLGYASSSQPSQASVENFDIDTDDLTEDYDEFQSRYGVKASKSELESYLQEPVIIRKQNPDFDVLGYWKENSLRFPELSLMARDVLSIPITTVASESAFSHGGRIIGDYRTSLLPDNVEAILCCRDWFGINNGMSAIEEEDKALIIDLDKFLQSEQASTSDVVSLSSQLCSAIPRLW